MGQVRMSFPQSMRYAVTVRGHEYVLRPKWFSVLEILVLNKNRYVSMDNLVTKVWPDPDNEPEQAENTIKVYLHYLRGLDLTVSGTSGLGYMLVDKDEVAMTTDARPTNLKALERSAAVLMTSTEREGRQKRHLRALETSEAKTRRVQERRAKVQAIAQLLERWVNEQVFDIESLQAKLIDLLKELDKMPGA